MGRLPEARFEPARPAVASSQHDPLGDDTLSQSRLPRLQALEFRRWRYRPTRDTL